MSSIFLFITIVQTLIAAAMVGVILMQRSEGGALGVGGSPNGLMSARGAGDLLTRATAILATLFVLLSVTLAVLAANMHSGGNIDTSLQRGAPAPISDPLSAPAPGMPGNADPLSAAGASTAAPAGSAPPAETAPQGQTPAN
jgi:preprotein translocase subunit SecG